MANEKINNSDLVNLLIDNELINTKTESSQFLAALQSTFQELLMSKRTLKISGIGTFKLTKVEARKSVDVRTGNEIVIPEHDRVTFTPDSALKELVDAEPQEQPLDLPMQKLSNQAKELADILAQINGGDEPEKPENPEPIEPETKLETEPETTTTNNLGVPNETPANELQSTENQQDTDTEAESEKPKTPEPNEQQREIWRTIVNNIGKEQQPDPAPEKSNIWRWILPVAIVLLLVGGGFVANHFAGDIIYTWCEPHIKAIQKPFDGCGTKIANGFEQFAEKCGKTCDAIFTKIKEKTEELTAEKPQIEAETKETVEPKIVESQATEPEITTTSAEPNFDKMRVYTDIMAHETIKPGVHLAILSRKYWGHKDFWVYLYEANQKVIKNPNNVEIGTKIAVPRLDARLVNANDPKAVQYAIDLGKKLTKRN